MFFQEKIKSIDKSDRVLEIGPGATPFRRADVFLDIKYNSEEERSLQFGNPGKNWFDEKIIYYDGEKFPFEDKSFDYVVCSHVVEHVPNIHSFMSEIFRVGRKGYLEFPLIYYDYLYGIKVHENFVKYDGEKLLFMKKSDSGLLSYLELQSFFYHGLEKKYNHLSFLLKEHMFQGFEWFEPFEILETSKISDLVLNKLNFSEFKEEHYIEQISYKKLINALLNKFKNKVFL